MKEPAKWEVKNKITGAGDSAKVISQLVCNGKVVHELGGPTSHETLTAYAKRMNEKGEPEPDPKVRIGADGYHFRTPPKKANTPKTVIPSMAAWAKKHGIT